MTINLEQAGKRFGRDWVFRKLNYRFEPGNSYAILGPNGSGKSTLLQVMAGKLSLTEGTVQFSNAKGAIEIENVFRHIALCAPYMQLPEEFTLSELLTFHFKFKQPLNGFSVQQLIELLELEPHRDKQIRYFSSGMKQRVKLCIAVMSDVSALLLDEPATNLDEAGVRWYRQLLENHLGARLLVVSSNRADEYAMCRDKLNISDFR